MFTVQIESYDFLYNKYSTLFEISNATALDWRNSYVYGRLLAVKFPFELSNVEVILNFEYIDSNNWNHIHNSTRGVVMSPNYPCSCQYGGAPYAEFTINCPKCLEDDRKGEIILKIEFIDFGSDVYINITSDGRLNTR